MQDVETGEIWYYIVESNHPDPFIIEPKKRKEDGEDVEPIH